MGRQIKLLADAMLGRLARWLRILGYDTAYLADTDDFAVMRLARAEDRLILTRDQELARRPGLRAMLIESDQLDEQLIQVGERLGPPPRSSGPRCPVCNVELAEASAESVARCVPPYVQRTQSSFSSCTSCGRVYWQGTHWQRMREFVLRLRDETGSDKIEWYPGELE
jgi:uncharacterized protein with PIN domain